MSFKQRFVSVGFSLGRSATMVCVALSVSAGCAAAQSPWVVTITPTLNPLPIGLCAAVRLEITDSTKQVPRNAAGYRVTLADFDLAVSAPKEAAVAGVYFSPSNWSVCACQKARPGTVATITASYPAQALAQDKRVAGVAVAASATFAIGKAIGDLDQAPCQAPLARSKTATPVPTLPVSMPPPATAATAPPPASSASAPSSATTSAGADTTRILGTPTSVPRQPLPPGAGPSTVHVAGTGAEAVLTWTAPSLAPSTNPPVLAGYIVERWKSGDPVCCRSSSPMLTALQWRDKLMQQGMWRYRVSAVYADGRRASLLSDNYDYPGKE